MRDAIAYNHCSYKESHFGLSRKETPWTSERSDWPRSAESIFSENSEIRAVFSVLRINLRCVTLLRLRCSYRGFSEMVLMGYFFRFLLSEFCFF